MKSLEAQIADLAPWHHDIELAPGLRTGSAPTDVDPDRFGDVSLIRPMDHMRKVVGAIYEGDLGGRSFLDCGCNGGGNCFAAIALGAGRAFGFDAREHWINQAKFVAERLPAPSAEFEVCKLEELSSLKTEPFDVTMFAGLLYHLPDPVAGLRTAADLTRELLIVNTATRPSKEDALVLNIESDSWAMSGVDRLAWLPTSERVVAAMLDWCGFPHKRLLWNVGADERGWGRMLLVAAREKATFAHLDSLAKPGSAGEYRGRQVPAWLAKLYRAVGLN